jgi:hypothetical protein
MSRAPDAGTRDLYSFRRSRNTSFFASGLLAIEYSTPCCSPTNSRSVPGQRAMRSGWWNFASGKTRTDLNFGGGSGEPVTFDVVHGLRFGSDFGSSAAAWGRATTTARATSANPAAAVRVRAMVRGDIVGIPE